ncbi:MAG: pyridoxal phosphate-dependent aminotransferase, partial [Polyangia bacterium]
AAGPDELVREAEARLELIADTYLSVGAPVQEAAPRLIALISDVGAQLAARVRIARAELAARVSGTALQLLDAEGGWSAILRVPRTRSEEEWVLQLLDDGVVVHPGFFFDMPEEAYLVVSLIAKPEDFSEGIERLIARVHAGL